jgi:hypothetical protein
MLVIEGKTIFRNLPGHSFERITVHLGRDNGPVNSGQEFQQLWYRLLVVDSCTAVRRGRGGSNLYLSGSRLWGLDWGGLKNLERVVSA